MANPEHLKILKQGWPTWNKWRKQHASVIPDLSGADLTQVELRTAHLERANLKYVNLTKVDLQGGYLSGSDLSAAKLDFTNLGMAHLSETALVKATLLNVDLTFADLSNVDFRRATIGFVEFRGAKLKGADFSEAFSGYNNYREVDLSDVKGLETVSHTGPSNIGIDTVYLSKGNVPESFLRGCGIPEDFIVYMRSLTAEPIRFYSCFISYSSKDQDFAERLHANLQNRNVRCWYAPEDLKIGDKIRDRIDESIRLRDKLLLILSEHSIASDWVEHEVESALEDEKQRGRTILFPIRLDDTVMESSKAWAALIRRTRHIGDFTRWKEHDSYQMAFERLLRDLKAD